MEFLRKKFWYWKKRISSLENLIKELLGLPYQHKFGQYHASISYSFCCYCNARSNNLSTRCIRCTKWNTSIFPCKNCPPNFCKCIVISLEK